ncbi:MAG: hydroxymethylbilane synthase [Flavobacteriia bacterium]|nr:hydroxymethylbilane synthase [Flavobacteriia bacterium]
MIRIGTRQSPLALWQANAVKEKLEALGFESLLVPIESEGDQNLKAPLYQMGIQGIFTKSLDIALLNNKIDLAVHSLKDVPTQMPEGIKLSAVLPRGAYQDILVSHPDPSKKLEKVIGTGSLRRKAQWLRKFPDFKVKNLRGNIQKRLEKLSKSSWTGAVFAEAGFERLGINAADYKPLEWMLPAPAQGIIGISSVDQSPFENALEKINDASTALCAHIERTFLATLEGGCTAPIGALARLENQTVYFKGGLFSLMGSEAIIVEETASLEVSQDLGIKMAHKILNQGGADLMQQIKATLSKAK